MHIDISMKQKKKSKWSVVDKDTGVMVALRKAIRYGDGLCITLPREWVEKHGIQPGDVLPVVCNSILMVVPAKDHQVNMVARAICGDSVFTEGGVEKKETLPDVRLSTFGPHPHRRS